MSLLGWKTRTIAVLIYKYSITEGMSERARGTGPSEGKVGLGGFLDATGDSNDPLDRWFPGRTVGVIVVDESLTVTDYIETNWDLNESIGDPMGQPLPVLHSVLTDQVTDAVKTAFEAQETVRFEVDDGTTDRLAVCAIPVAESVVLHLLDVGKSVRLSRELKKVRKTLDTLKDGIYVLDEAFVVTAINDAVTEITGYGRDELVGAHASKLAGDETLSMATEILEQLRTEDSEVGLIESSIRGADGESIPVETRFSTVEFGNGGQRRVGLVRDVRERRRNERLLRALNRSTRSLLRADSERAVCETIVGVAADIWSDAEVVAYTFDSADSRLVPVASAEVDPTAKGPGTEEWDAFATGVPDEGASPGGEAPTDGRNRGYEATSDEPTGRVIGEKRDERVEDETLYASLESHGLLTIEFSSPAELTGVVEPVERLAANAVAGLERVEREAELSRRREELSERNDRLERTREFNDLLRRTNGALVEADTLNDVATAVCEHLVDAERIEFAWFGEIYRSDEGLQPVAVAGDGEGYLGDLSVVGIDPTNPPSADGSEPTVQAMASQTPTRVSDTSAGRGDSSWRERAFVRGFQSVASVPIQYNDLTYGVLSVYANQPRAFEGVLGDLLGDLGGTIGNAVNGLETKRSLHSETRVELGLRIVDRDALASRMSMALGEPVRIDGTIPDDEGRSVVYIQTAGDPDRLPASVLAVESVDRPEDGDAARAAVTVTRPTLFDRLVDYGVTVERFRVESDTAEITVDIPPSGDVRQLIEALDNHYDRVDLVSRREKSSGENANGSFPDTVGDRLTDRQYEVVQTAYLSGYFEWPRASTGEEVAETLDITQPTFNRHLRTVEQTLFSVFFGDDG